MRVLIYAPTKTSTQSGQARVGPWVLRGFGGEPQAPESLMGWAQAHGTADEVCLYFPTRQAAQDYATAQGWEAVVLPTQTRRVVPRNFAQTII